MLSRKYGVSMDSHLTKEQLAIARSFRSVFLHLIEVHKTNARDMVALMSLSLGVPDCTRQRNRLSIILLWHLRQNFFYFYCYFYFPLRLVIYHQKSLVFKGQVV
jgi:hypothetical protein